MASTDHTRSGQTKRKQGKRQLEIEKQCYSWRARVEVLLPSTDHTRSGLIVVFAVEGERREEKEKENERAVRRAKEKGKTTTKRSQGKRSEKEKERTEEKGRERKRSITGLLHPPPL